MSLNISILCGSSRTDSNTSRVGKAISRIAQESNIALECISIPDFTQFDIKLGNGGGIHLENLTEFQKTVLNSMQASQLIFILSPEYNWFPSPEIMHLINSFGSKNFANCWNHKVFATCGISSGRGGRIPAVQLSYVINKLINVMDFSSMVSAKMFESQFTPKVLDSEGNSLGNEEYDAGLKKFVDYNIAISERFLK